jgi:hypothetical protein
VRQALGGAQAHLPGRLVQLGDQSRRGRRRPRDVVHVVIRIGHEAIELQDHLRRRPPGDGAARQADLRRRADLRRLRLTGGQHLDGETAAVLIAVGIGDDQPHRRGTGEALRRGDEKHPLGDDGQQLVEGGGRPRQLVVGAVVVDQRVQVERPGRAGGEAQQRQRRDLGPHRRSLLQDHGDETPLRDFAIAVLSGDAHQPAAGGGATQFESLPVCGQLGGDAPFGLQQDLQAVRRIVGVDDQLRQGHHDAAAGAEARVDRLQPLHDGRIVHRRHDDAHEHGVGQSRRVADGQLHLALAEGIGIGGECGHPRRRVDVDVDEAAVRRRPRQLRVRRIEVGDEVIEGQRRAGSILDEGHRRRQAGDARPAEDAHVHRVGVGVALLHLEGGEDHRRVAHEADGIHDDAMVGVDRRAETVDEGGRPDDRRSHLLGEGVEIGVDLLRAVAFDDGDRRQRGDAEATDPQRRRPQGLSEVELGAGRRRRRVVAAAVVAAFLDGDLRAVAERPAHRLEAEGRRHAAVGGRAALHAGGLGVGQVGDALLLLHAIEQHHTVEPAAGDEGLLHAVDGAQTRGLEQAEDIAVEGEMEGEARQFLAAGIDHDLELDLVAQLDGRQGLTVRPPQRDLRGAGTLGAGGDGPQQQPRQQPAEDETQRRARHRFRRRHHRSSSMGCTWRTPSPTRRA